ncbi:hypothetical protein JCM10450v2_007398 [Rhodotorula kratochvilovae]
MFRLPFLSSSSSPSAPTEAEQDPLTTLPPRRFSRRSSSASTSFAAPPLPPPSLPVQADDWSSRHSFAELLSRDTRGSVLVRDEEALVGAQGNDESGGTGAERGEAMLAFPGADFGVVGPDAHLLLQELQRLRTSLALKRRRRTGYIAGALSLIVLGVTAWFEVEACWALVKSGGSGRGALRWVEMGSWLAVLLLWVPVLLFLRSRRPALLAVVGLTSAALSAFLHLSLAFANFVLSFVWKEELDDRCDWGTDVAWTSLDKGNYCPGEGWKAWSIAAVVRLIVTIALLVVWLVFLRRYHRALYTPSIVSPSQLPSSELRTLLDRHRADIVPLSSTFHPPTLVAPHEHTDDLPAAPDRRTAFYASVSDGAWSYDPEHGRWASSATRESTPPQGGGVGAWVGAKVWGGIGWLLGVPSQTEATARGTVEKEFDEKAGEATTRRRDLDEHEHPAAGEHDDLDNADLAPSHVARLVSYASWSNELSHDRQDYRSLFSGLRRPASFASTQSSKRLSAGSTAPLLDPSTSSAADRPLPLLPHSTHDSPRTSRDLPPPPPPPKDRPSLERSSSTGSSGSTGGAIVYVRMSDGRLVRRLSTIASESDETRRSRSDATSAASFVGGAGGRGSGGSRSTLEGSFATSAEGFAGGEGAEEVLLDEEERS